MVAEGIKKRFAAAAEKKKSAGKSVLAGREYVEAYVDYVHFVEGIAMMAEGKVGHEHEAEAAGHHH
jgi:hypothetical protein